MNQEVHPELNMLLIGGEPPADIFPPLRLVSPQIPQGNFNENTLVADSFGHKFIIREENPVGRSQELAFVTAEYKGVGFLDNPENGFRLRRSREQHAFAALLLISGIHTCSVAYSNDHLQMIRYEESAKSLAELWQDNDVRAARATTAALCGLLGTHSKGLVMGDRWGPNELLTTRGEIMFVDFDIAIFGPESKEFELASLLYFTAFFAQQNHSNSMDELAEIYRSFLAELKLSGVYNNEVLKRYIMNYFKYFKTQGKYRWSNHEEAEKFAFGVLHI